MDALRQLVQAEKDHVISDRRYLHRIPETGFNEVKTSAYVAETAQRASGSRSRRGSPRMAWSACSGPENPVPP